jgi:hypothetical protein
MPSPWQKSSYLHTTSLMMHISWGQNIYWAQEPIPSVSYLQAEGIAAPSQGLARPELRTVVPVQTAGRMYIVSVSWRDFKSFRADWGSVLIPIEKTTSDCEHRRWVMLYLYNTIIWFLCINNFLTRRLSTTLLRTAAILVVPTQTHASGCLGRVICNY